MLIYGNNADPRTLVVKRSMCSEYIDMGLEIVAQRAILEKSRVSLNLFETALSLEIESKYSFGFF